MSKYKGSKSEKNILAAFEGESKARNKYTYYAQQAKSVGQDSIAALFEKMSDNEREHAKVWFKVLHDGLGDLATNLADAASGESYECSTMYPTFAKEAYAEGFDELGNMFERVAAIEKDHEKRFVEALGKFLAESGSAAPTNAPKEQPREQRAGVRCMFCGFVDERHHDVCPVCGAIGAFERVMLLV